MGRAQRAAAQHSSGSLLAHVEALRFLYRVKSVHLCQRGVWNHEAVLRSNRRKSQRCGVPVETSAH